jgi:hypothetical protein
MRYTDLQGADVASRAQSGRQDVERTLRSIYDMRAQMDARVQNLLHTDITEHFNKTTGYNRNWISVCGPSVRESIKRVKLRAIKNVRPTTDWLVLKLSTS